jgi:hypothetical protein
MYYCSGGGIYGGSELFSNSKPFQESCKNDEIVQEIKVYPNPSFGEYWVEGQKLEYFEIFDNLGRQVMSSFVRDKLFKTAISISDQPEGNYILKVVDIYGVQWVFSLIKLQE